jgi:hypothetical protein
LADLVAYPFRRIRSGIAYGARPLPRRLGQEPDFPAGHWQSVHGPKQTSPATTLLNARQNTILQSNGRIMQSISGFLQPLQNGSNGRLEFNEILGISPDHDLLQFSIHRLALSFAA